jgi:hypothetical protein
VRYCAIITNKKSHTFTSCNEIYHLSKRTCFQSFLQSANMDIICGTYQSDNANLIFGNFRASHFINTFDCPGEDTAWSTAIHMYFLELLVHLSYQC